MKTTWPSAHRGILSGLIAFALSIPSLADQTITGNLTVTGAAVVNGTASVGGDLDVEGNNLTLGNNAGNYGVGTFYLPSGSDGARWRLTRVSAWLWEVDNAGTVSPAMRLDASNNLTLYSGGTAALTLNPAAKSLALGSATLTANGTALTTNGALAVGGALSAPSVVTTTGTLTGGGSGLTLNAGGADQNVVLSPSGNGNVIINGNLGVGTATPGAKVEVAGNVRISSSSDALLGVGTPGIGDDGSFEVFAFPTVAATNFFEEIFAQSRIRSYSNVPNTTKPYVAGLLITNEVTSGGARSGLVVDVSTPTSYSSPAGVGVLRGAHIVSAHMGSGDLGSVLGQVTAAANFSSGGVVTNLWGSKSQAFNGKSEDSAAITTNLTAADVGVRNQGTSSLVSVAKGVNVANLYNSGTITNTYGVYVGDITSGTQTNKPFSFYASDPGADNYFAGNVGIGTAAPSERLHISGQIKSETSGTNFATIVGATADSNVGFVVANNGGATPGQWSMRNDGATGSWVLRRDLGGGEGERLIVTPTGDVSVTGNLTLAAGNSSRAPLVLQSGRVLTTPAFGAIEFNGTNLYVTNNASSPTRQTLAFAATTLAGYGITDPVVLTSDSYANPAWITSLAASKITGTLSAAAMPAFTGDATSSAGGTTLTLANSGATAGTYTKVTVDAKGRVTAGANLVSADVTTALGYTPVNKAGDTMSGALTVTALTASNGTVTGGSTGLALNAGGTNQNVSLTPSGTGNTVLGGNVGIGTTTPTAKLDVAGSANIAGNLKLAAGTTTQAPVTLQGGTLLTAPVFGAVEFDGTTLYVTNNSGSPTRKPLAYAATSLSGYGITDPVALTSGSYSNPTWISSLAAGKLTGTLPAGTMPAFTGDATSSAGGTTLTLANSGATAGTYTKVTVDAKGRVTAGANLASADVTTALGYVPVNKAGDTMSGALTATALTAINGTVTGGTSGLTLSAGGANQNINLATSGTGAVITSAPTVIANSTASTSASTGALTVAGGVGITGNINVGGAIATGGLTNFPVRIHTLNLSAQPTSQFFPIALSGLPQGKIYHFSIELPGQASTSAFNQHSLAGTARGGGWSDSPPFFEVTNTFYDGNERSILGLYRGTQGWVDIALYVRGGATYYVTTDAPTVAAYTAAQTLGDSTLAIKDSTGADVSGTSAAITRMFDSYGASAGRYTDRAIATSSTVASTSATTGALVVAGGVGIGGDLNVGGTFSAANYTASGGTITGGSTGLTVNGGGSNQNIALVPSGTGKVTTNLGDVAALSANGFAARTGSGAYAARSIVGTAGQVSVTNGDGVAGNPTISLPSTITQATTFDANLTVGTGRNFFVGGYGSGSDVGAIFTPNDAGTWGWISNIGSTDSLSIGRGSVVGVNPAVSINLTSGNTSITSSAASTSTTTGALTVAGGVGVAGTLSTRTFSASTGLGTLPAGTTSGQNMLYVSGSGDTGGTSDLRPNSIQTTALGANSMAVRALDVAANAQNSAGTASMVGVRVLTSLTSTGNGNGTAFSASPYVSNTGNLAWWVGYEADNGSFSSTGDVTGPMTAFRNATFGRAAATTVTAFHAQDLVKGSGIAAGFRGQVSAATGKYNLYLDGTAANLLAGQTSITNSTASTSSTTGALTVAGGVGIAGDLNVGGTFSSTNYTASGGNVTGGSSGLNLNAGGSNQNIVLTPSGSGVVKTNLGDVAALSVNGFAARTGSGAYAARAIVGTAGQVNVANGDGVAGNPTISLPSTITQATTFSNSLVVGTTTSGLLTIGQSGPSAISEILMSGAGSYGMSWKNTGLRAWNFTGASSGADFLTTFESTGGGKHNISATGTLAIQSTTASTSTTTGSATFGGGIGVTGAGYFGGTVDSNSARHNSISSSSSTDISLTAGAGNQNVNFNPSGTGAAVVNGSAGGWALIRTVPASAALSSAYNAVPYGTISGTNPQWYIGHRNSAQGPLSIWRYDGTTHQPNELTLSTSGVLSLASATDATSTTSGALQVAGGGSFQKNLYLGGNLNVAGNVKLAAGTTTQAPVTLQGGTLLSTPVFGAVEFDGTTLYVTNNSGSPTRKPLAYAATTLSGYGISDPVALTTGSYSNPAWITSLAAGKLTGTLPAGTMPAFSGDATSSAGGTTLTLANSGATAGTYTKVTVDAKGRVTTGANFASSDVTTALGYTPVKPTGDTMSGALTATALTATNGAITGGTTGLTLNAGGANQSVSLIPSGTGSTILGGNVGIGTSAPTSKLDVGGTGARVVVRDLGENINATFAERMSLYARSTGPDDESNEFGAKLSFRSLWGGTENEVGYIAGFNDYAWKAGMVFAVKPQGNGALPVPAVVIRESGNVGIGTTSPTTKLDVNGDVKVTGNLVVTGTLTAANSTGSTTGVVTGSTNGLALNAGGSGNQNITLSPTGSGSVVLNGNVGVGTSTPFQKFEVSGGYARISYAGAPFLDFFQSTAGADLKTTRIGSRDGAMLFESVNDAYTAPIEHMRIAANGNVGIGTATPRARLDLGSANGSNRPLLVLNPDAAIDVNYNGYFHNDLLMGSFVSNGYAQHYLSFGYLQDPSRKFHIGSASNSAFDGTTDFKSALTVTSGGDIGIGTVSPVRELTLAHSASVEMVFQSTSRPVDQRNYRIYSANGGLFFGTLNDAGTSGVNHVTIEQTSGNVGIGTTAPTAKLHVNGTARFDGPVRIAKQGDLEMGEFTQEPNQ